MKQLSLTLALVSLVALFLAAMTARADVVRPAPNFTVAGGRSVKSFHGQPIVLVIAESPRTKLFRKEIARLEKEYQSFAARNAIFVVAFTQEGSKDGIIHSNIPFVTANDGAGIAASCGITGKFGVIVIGKDGNMDLRTEKFAAPYMIRDAILNNYEVQTAERGTL